MNIFSIFDPSTSTFLSLNWISMLLMFLYLPFQFWLIPSRLTLFWTNIINFMFNEFKILIKYSASNIILFISLLLLIFFNNFLGLFPYIFTASSHMNFCLSLSLTFWLGMMIYSIFNFINNFFTHLTPQGTPFILMPFMVIIESISLIIRPITLAIRLTANMIAGHLLLSLLGSSGEIINNMMLLNMMILSQILLFLLEIFVSFIQAYVFSILSTLYSSEI
nr:ATP synthase F0 subunit 6 [Monomorium triviale]